MRKKLIFVTELVVRFEKVSNRSSLVTQFNLWLTDIIPGHYSIMFIISLNSRAGKQTKKNILIIWHQSFLDSSCTVSSVYIDGHLILKFSKGPWTDLNLTLIFALFCFVICSTRTHKKFTVSFLDHFFWQTNIASLDQNN
jgi:hypothetical protein